MLELLTANYTFLNERLAKHYGIPHLYGSHFRRVSFTDDPARQRDRVRDYIRSGLEEGARLVVGGPDAPDGVEQRLEPALDLRICDAGISADDDVPVVIGAPRGGRRGGGD